MKLALRLTFHRAAEMLGITTDDVRSLVVEMPRKLPAIYVTQVGHAEPYQWQLLRVDSAGHAFDMSIGGIDGSVHTGFLRIERAALEKFIRDNDLPVRHKTELAPHPATGLEPPAPEPQAAAPVADESASKAVVVPFKKAALIAAHVHEWPTIERDIADANTNGLAAAAKAGVRGWFEDAALIWARANGKLISAAKPADSLAQAMHNLGALPSQKHTMQG